MPLPENFEFAIQFVLKTEGGTNIDPVDRGGKTKFGISEKTYPDLDILNLTLEQAKQIYFEDYWLVQHCDAFEKSLATVIFDSSVNCGKGNAGKWLQEASIANNFQVKVDGVIGKKTAIVSSFVRSERLIYGIAGRRAKHYSALIKKHPEQIKYIKGWNNRLGDLLLYI